MPMQADLLLCFLIGGLLIVAGMGLFSLGAEQAMMPIGSKIGTALTKTKNLPLILGVSFLLGFAITVAEPDLQVLAQPVPHIKSSVLLITVGVGVGFFMTVCMLRILTGASLRWLLIACYALIFGLAAFTDRNYLSIAFDSGGVTTGPMTVPFILAMGLGVSMIRSDRSAEADSFGLVALCSIGPILSVLILGFFYNDSEATAGVSAAAFADTREINYNDTCFYRRTSVIDGLTMKWRGENVELTSSTSYQFIDDNMTLDQDFLPLSYFTMTQKKTEHAATQDVIVSGSAADGKLRWIGGAFAFFRHMKMLAPVTFKDYGIESLIAGKWNEMNPYYPIVWDEDSFVLGSGFTMPSAGAAAYGEVSYATRRFTLVAGLRFDYEQSRLDYTSDCSTSYTVMQRAGDGSLSPYAFHPVEIHNGGSLKRSFTQLLPKISASYSIPSRHEAKVRLTVAKGYKAGGFNTQMFSDVLQQQLMESMGIGRRYDVDQVVGYKPENSWNAELGALIKTADKQFSASVTAFYIHCRDQQLTVFPEGDITGRIMTNAGKARSAGIEVSVAYSPVERLTLNAAYGYTNAKFIEFNNGKEDYSGRFVPYAPQNTIFAAANYLIPAQFGPLRYISTGLSTQGIGKIYWNEDNSTAQNLYFKLDASVKLICNKFSVDLWAKNITATQYSTFYFVSIQHEFLQRGKPVQFGATLRVNI